MRISVFYCWLIVLIISTLVRQINEQLFLGTICNEKVWSHNQTTSNQSLDRGLNKEKNTAFWAVLWNVSLYVFLWLFRNWIDKKLRNLIPHRTIGFLPTLHTFRNVLDISLSIGSQVLQFMEPLIMLLEQFLPLQSEPQSIASTLSSEQAHAYQNELQSGNHNRCNNLLLINDLIVSGTQLYAYLHDLIAPLMHFKRR